ncbi:MAG: hypothetical protein HRU70_13390 [Phycisphaeraceae bacterium]|nr:MAG: hypothetical protein HRU70_13390 [Phycisphaeraceae bacterium]
MSRRGADRNRWEAGRPGWRCAPWVVALGSIGVVGALGQPAGEPLSGVVADQRMTGYLAERGLDRLLAVYYTRRLSEGTADERRRAGEELGKLYVRLLGRAKDGAERAELEARCEEFLRAVPEAESLELRIELSKTTFLKAEEIAERHRLRLASEAERQEALRVFDTAGASFRDVAQRVQRRVEGLERREDQVRGEELERLRVELGEARRVRSLSRFYAGWSEVHASVLTPSADRARLAMEHFGYLLNAASGQPATVERLPRGLLKYDHIARAALGCAMAQSSRGATTEALRWLDAISSGEGVPAGVADQLFYRRLGVLAGGGYWPEVQIMVRRRREPVAGGDGGDRVLSAAEARLLAVVSLEAPVSGLPETFRGIPGEMARVALGDLISAGQLGEVLDLVSRYGVEPIGGGSDGGGSGFIVNFVRGVKAYDGAREAHKSAGGANAEEPTTDPSVRQAYEDAAGFLSAASRAEDAGKFPDARVRAVVREGWALFYAGKAAEAATRFESAADRAPAGDLRRDAAWFAIHAYDRAVEGGRKDLAKRRDDLSAVFLAMYPSSEQAARVLLRKAGADLMAPEKAAGVLLAVEPGSALYGLARRQASRLLYEAFRRSGAKDRDFAARRFVGLARAVLDEEMRRSVEEESPERAAEAMEAGLLRARQIVEASLSMSSPDTAVAEEALSAIERLSSVHGADLSRLAGEVLFARLRIALARGDDVKAEGYLERLDREGGEYGSVARRVAFARALAAWERDGSSAGASAVVRWGTPLIERIEAERLPVGEASNAGVFDAVARASVALWRERGEAGLLASAVRLDRVLLGAGVNTREVMRRHAGALEASGDASGALGVWRRLMNALPQGESAWFEARVESLRLLASSDASGAREALAQLRALYPGLGGEPWASRIAEIERGLAGGER